MKRKKWKTIRFPVLLRYIGLFLATTSMFSLITLNQQALWFKIVHTVIIIHVGLFLYYYPKKQLQYPDQNKHRKWRLI
jgi:hypothetical protein